MVGDHMGILGAVVLLGQGTGGRQTSACGAGEGPPLRVRAAARRIFFLPLPYLPPALPPKHLCRISKPARSGLKRDRGRSGPEAR